MPNSLRVSKSKPKARRSTEASFEHVLRDIAKAENALFLKSDATDGWPDRYCGSGVWIEFKSLVFSRLISPYSYLRPEQRATMRQLVAFGDDPWVCILLLHEATETEWVIFCPFNALLEEYGQKCGLDAIKKAIYTHARADFEEYFKEWLKFNKQDAGI